MFFSLGNDELVCDKLRQATSFSLGKTNSQVSLSKAYINRLTSISSPNSEPSNFLSYIRSLQSLFNPQPTFTPQPANMKFTTALVALVSGLGAMAAPIEEAAQTVSIEKRAPGGMDYVQNYNGGAAGFQSNLNAGTFSLKWNSGTDVVAGLGWKTGTAR